MSDCVVEMKRTNKVLRFTVDEQFKLSLSIESLCQYYLAFCGVAKVGGGGVGRGRGGVT